MADQPIHLDDVKRLTVHPGDTLVFRHDGELTATELEELHDTLQNLVRDLCGDARFVLLTGGLHLDHIATGDITGVPV